MSLSALEIMADNLGITRLLNQMAYAEDTLDWQLFESCYTSRKPLKIDLSSHLSEYSSDITMTAAELARTAHIQLSGFDSTQHSLSNYVINIDEDGTKALARAYVTAYHAYKRPAEEGPSFVLVRGVWLISCEKESDGVWKAAGVKISRLTAAEGDENLYEVAKQKGQGGNGRAALTLWKE